jgi:hypothetical protein
VYRRMIKWEVHFFVGFASLRVIINTQFARNMFDARLCVSGWDLPGRPCLLAKPDPSAFIQAGAAQKMTNRHTRMTSVREISEVTPLRRCYIP